MYDCSTVSIIGSSLKKFLEFVLDAIFGLKGGISFFLRTLSKSIFVKKG